MLSDVPPEPHSLDEVAKRLTQWIGIGGAVFGVLSFAMLLGMWFGPLKDMPQRFDNIMTQLSEIKSRSDKTDWAMDVLKSRADSLTIQFNNTINELRQAKDDLRKAELTIAQLESNNVSKVELAEWKAQLEREKNIGGSPILKKLP